ncbi:MAG: M56 family metallopeptidase [Sedimentisphaerales bacterium]|jgi:bla regulator protein BlaR1
MGTIISILNKAGEIFCQHGLTMLVQFGLLTSLLFLADILIRKRVKASLRYCLWSLVLIKLVLPTTLSLPTGIGYLTGVNFSVQLTQAKLPEPQIQTVYAPTTSMPVQTDSEFTRPINSPQDIAESRISRAAESPALIETTPLNWQGGIFLAWLFGVLALLAGFIRRIASIKKLINQSKPASERLVDMVHNCQERIGVKGIVELRLSNDMVSPAVCGLFRHVIIVPTGLLEKMDRSKLAMVLMHELSHVKRADLWVNLFQTILQIFYFYNPFVWSANAYIRRVREQAVDEMVLTHLNCAAANYSDTLIDVAEKAFSQPRFSLATVSIVESKSKLKERIKIMLSKPIPKDTKIGFAGLVLIIAVAAVMLPMAKGIDKKTEPEFVIKGSVKDATTGKPITGAKVADAERYAGGKYGTITDSNGNYSYKTWYEEHDIKCEASGYKTETKVLPTKLLGSEQEKILDFALSSKGGSDNTDYARATVKEGVGFDEFVVGDANCTGEFIKRKLGETEEEWKNEKEGWWLAYHKKYGLDFFLNLQKNTLYEIRLNEGFKGKLSSGISMSSAKQDVFAVYGEPIREEVVGNFDKRFEDRVLLLRESDWVKGAHIAKIYYSDKGLLFWFDGDKIIQMVVYPRSSKTNGMKANTLLPEKSANDYSSVTVQEGVGFDGFVVGDANCTGEFIKATLGEPEEDFKNERQGWWIAYHKKYGLDFWLNLQKNTLYEIRLNEGFKGKLSSGISMSSTKQDVFKTYGEPIREVAADDLHKLSDDRVLFISKDGISKINYNEKGVLFWFDGDKVTQICVGTVSSPGNVDVAVEDFNIMPYPEGGLYTVTVSIRNRGRTESPKFGVNFYRGDPNNVKPMTHGAGPIKAGDVWKEGSMPFALKEGTNEIAVLLDPDNTIGEPNRTNNEASMTVIVKDGKIVEKKVSPSSAESGSGQREKSDVQVQQQALRPIGFKITSSKFQNGDSIEITDLYGSAGVIKPGETYIVSGRYKLGSRDDAMLHVYATNGETSSSQGPIIKRGEGRFTRTFTLLKEGDLHLSFYPANNGESFGGVYFAQRGADAETEAVEDLSTPEAAYASINRVSAGGDLSGWQRVSVKEIAEKLARGNKNGKMGVEPEWAKVLLNAKILEVRTCENNIAAVMAKLPQEFSSKQINKPIDVRHLKLEDGRWLNAGNDRVGTIEEARAQFDSLCKDKKTNSGDKKAMNPVGQTIAAAELLPMAKGVKAGEQTMDEQSRGEEIIKRMAEVNRYWLISPPSQTKNYSYEFALYKGETKTFKVSEPSSADRAIRQGITYDSLLHKLAKEPFAATYTSIEEVNGIIRADFKLKESIQIRMGNGLRGSWYGSFNQPVEGGTFWIDAKKMLPVRAKCNEVYEYFSDYAAVDKTHYVPLRVKIDKNDMPMHMHFNWTFKLHKPGLWLFDESHYSIDENKPVVAASIDNVRVNEDSSAGSDSAQGEAAAHADSSPPAVVKTTPVTFANDISPDLNNLTVTFNQRMTDKSWSWTGGGETLPKMAGQPSYDQAGTTCRLPVSLEPGKVYWVGINSPSFQNFKSVSGTPAKQYVILFATKGSDGKPTPIPEDLITKAKSVNESAQKTSSGPEGKESRTESAPYTQITYDDIRPDGTITFKNTIRETNKSGREITTQNFINSDFVQVTAMRDVNGRDLKFTSVHDGDIYRYEVTFNEPISPNGLIEYTSDGTMKGLIKPVAGSEGVFQYYMRHSPAAGQPTQRVETYLLPAGAELISTTPKDIEKRTKDGRIELHVEKMIPPDGSITTSFQYRVP